MPFCGDDESKDSNNRNFFLKLVKLSTKLNMDIGVVVLKNAPNNQQMVAPSI